LIVIGKIGANITNVTVKLTIPMIIVYNPNFDKRTNVANNNGIPDIVININGSSNENGSSVCS